MKYIELHSCSAFSFLGGASCPEDLAVRAAELELPAAALLDRDGVYGSPRFHTAAKRAGIRAHVGAEISVEGFGIRAGLPQWMPPTVALEQPVRLALLVKNRAGYQNLCRLLTRAHLRSESIGISIPTGKSITAAIPSTKSIFGLSSENPYGGGCVPIALSSQN